MQTSIILQLDVQSAVSVLEQIPCVPEKSPNTDIAAWDCAVKIDEIV
jgi:hypothetical protein